MSFINIQCQIQKTVTLIHQAKPFIFKRTINEYAFRFNEQSFLINLPFLLLFPLQQFADGSPFLHYLLKTGQRH